MFSKGILVNSAFTSLRFIAMVMLHVIKPLAMSKSGFGA
jgi:hypothetical protein